jgi:hypothetical protein
MFLSRRIVLRTIAALLCPGARLRAEGNVKLYLKDGSFQLVREYKVVEDRVRYYTVERSDWEEIPLELVDLKKTVSEAKARDEERKEAVKAVAEEDKAERDAAREVRRVPPDPGVYLIAGEAVTAIKEAEPKVVNNKGRHVLKLVSPVPMVSDKSWLEVDGPHSANVVAEDRPQFYIRLNAEERFGMLRMSDHKGNRVVEKLTIIPVSKEVMEEPDMVDTFRQQVGEGLYKIWPEKPLSSGQYAVVEYTEGKVNMRIWDYAYAPK